MASLELPFARGTTWDSGTYGAVPSKFLGSKYTLEDGTVLQVMKNVDAAAIAGCKLVTLISPTAFTVSESSAAKDAQVVGVVDSVYSDAPAATVPNNSLFYMVKGGIGKVMLGDSATAGDALASHATDGTAGDILTQSNIVGILTTTAASGATGTMLCTFPG